MYIEPSNQRIKPTACSDPTQLMQALFVPALLVPVVTL